MVNVCQFPPNDDRSDPEGTDQMKIPRLCEPHRGCLVLQSAQMSTWALVLSSVAGRGARVADHCLAVRPARAIASGFAPPELY